MRQVPAEVREAETEASSSIAASIDRLLSRAPGRAWSAEAISIEPHRFSPGLWMAEAWLTNGSYLSVLGHSSDDVRERLEDALERLGR